MSGALSIVCHHMEMARLCESHANVMIENGCWSTAAERKLEAEKHKVLAGLELLLWILARLQMKAEPNPWHELQEKLSKENS